MLAEIEFWLRYNFLITKVQRILYVIVVGGTAVDPDSGLEDVAHVYKDYNGTKYSVVLGQTDVVAQKNSYYKLQLLEADNKKKYVNHILSIRHITNVIFFSCSQTRIRINFYITAYNIFTKIKRPRLSGVELNAGSKTPVWIPSSINNTKYMNKFQKNKVSVTTCNLKYNKKK